MKKSINIVFSVAILILTLWGSTLLSQKRILENISVEEWIVPVYAVNTRGGKAPVLSRNDIELYVNGLRIRDFNFFKSDLFKPGKGKEERKYKRKEDVKTIILVFDTALSRATSIMKSKIIAKKIIEESKKNTKFVIFRIEPFWGMNYLAGPLSNKRILKSIIKKKIKVKENRRSVSSNLEDFKGKDSKYEGGESSFFFIQQKRYLSYKSSQFALSFRSLYYAISNLLGSKFIYLFSEGISNASWVPGDIHGGTMAKYLAKSGAMLFFINPAGGKGEYMGSGEDFLKNLAEISGGKYIYGDTKMVSEEIRRIHRSYYELTFHTPENFSGDVINIDVRSKVKGIKILTIRNLEKSRGYLKLSDIEKRLLVLNIISNNPLFRLPLSVEDAKVKKESRIGDHTLYSIKIPAHFLGRTIDIYRVHTSSGNSKPIIKLNSEKIETEEFNLKMKNIPGYKNNFLLINYELGFALVHGVKRKKVRIEDFKYNDGTVIFKLMDFKRKRLGNKRVALLKVSLKIVSGEGVELSDDTKEITMIKRSGILKVPLKIKPERDFYILITVKDKIAKNNTTLTKLIK